MIEDAKVIKGGFFSGNHHSISSTTALHYQKNITSLFICRIVSFFIISDDARFVFASILP